MEKMLKNEQKVTDAANDYCSAYYDCDNESERKAVTSTFKQGYYEGYEQAEKDLITRIREQVKKWMPDNPEGDEHISGKRVAFHSVLHLLDELENEEL